MNYQHIENLLIRYRGQQVHIKTLSGGVYEGVVSDVTNDYVSLKAKADNGNGSFIVVLLHSIEAILPQKN